MRQVTKRGEDEIGRHEGLSLKAYKDVAGYLTIGIGHLLTRSELSSGKVWIAGEPVRWSDGITEAQAFALLRQDLDEAEEAVLRLAPELTDNQFDALVSFVFNVGVGAFEKSTLLRLLRAGRPEEVPAQMKRWNRAGGRVVGGLTIRRDAEATLWES